MRPILVVAALLWALGTPSQTTQSTITDNVVEQVNIAVASGVPPYTSTVGKTLAAVNPAIKTLVFPVVGDSITGNSLPSLNSPMNAAAVLQLNIYDGLVYRAAAPLLGTSSVAGNFSIDLFDRLVTDGTAAQVIIVPIGIGGSTSFDWTPSGVLNQRARVACWTIRGLGWLENPNFKFGTIYITGINDGGTVNGVTPGTTSQQWQDRFHAWQASMAAYGCNFDTFVPISTRLTNVVNPNIQAAQYAVRDNIKTFSLADFDAMTANPANTVADRTHWSNAGSLAAVNLAAPALELRY